MNAKPDELFAYMAIAGGHAPSLLQVVDRRLAWCALCGTIVNVGRDDDLPEGSDAAALLAALEEES